MQRYKKVLAWAVVGLALVVLVPTLAPAVCSCACVDGQAKPICPPNSPEIPTPCPVTVCPLVMPPAPSTPPPPQPQTLSPDPTTQCTNRQVYNPQTGQNEWRRICS